MSNKKYFRQDFCFCCNAPYRKVEITEEQYDTGENWEVIGSLHDETGDILKVHAGYCPACSADVDTLNGFFEE